MDTAVANYIRLALDFAIDNVNLRSMNNNLKARVADLEPLAKE